MDKGGGMQKEDEVVGKEYQSDQEQLVSGEWVELQVEQLSKRVLLSL
jgi:hypothetical protein